MLQTFPEWRFNHLVIKHLLKQLEGERPDEDFLKIWQKWVGIREMEYGTYVNLMKKEDFENLIKISKKERETAVNILYFLCYKKKFDRITSNVMRSFNPKVNYESRLLIETNNKIANALL